MFPTPPADVPPDPVTPVPPPVPSHMAPLSRGALALMLAGLSMLGPLSIDTYLPAFGAIQGSLQASPLEVQQSLTFTCWRLPAWCCGMARSRMRLAAAM